MIVFFTLKNIWKVLHTVTEELSFSVWWNVNKKNIFFYEIYQDYRYVLELSSQILDRYHIRHFVYFCSIIFLQFWG